MISSSINYWTILCLFIIGYLCGNLCTAVLISNSILHDDIRKHGSGNPGTTNMSRVFGLKYGIATLLIDSFKAFIPCLIIRLTFSQVEYTILLLYVCTIGLGVIVGHNYPIVLHFKGGKGFASAIGVLLVIYPIPTIILLIGVIIGLLVIDKMSICALGFFFCAFLYSFIFTSNKGVTIFCFIYFVLAVIAHRGNIQRLISGTEPNLHIKDKLFRKK